MNDIQRVEIWTVGSTMRRGWDCSTLSPSGPLLLPSDFVADSWSGLE